MRAKGLIIITTLFLLLVMSCKKTTEPESRENPYKPLELSTKSAEFVEKGSAFTFDYIQRIGASTQENFIVSPLSMQFLLGMLLDGAQGKTADEISSVLGFGAGEVEAVNEYARSVLGQLPELDQESELVFANALFADRSYSVQDQFRKTVEQYYQAGVLNVDFGSKEAALDAVNGWCNQKTRGLIPRLLEDSNTNIMALLLNAIYFKSRWTDAFPKASTAEKTFTDETGGVSKVKMMSRNGNYGYLSGEVFEAVQIPYGNGVFSMTVFLPQGKNTLADVMTTLKKADWIQIRGQFVPCTLDLWLPKFEARFKISLNDILSAMGMPSAFDSIKADFSALSKDRGYLSEVQQCAVIKVDEDGSEAAAVSSARIEKSASLGVGSPIVFHADRPFLYLISEASSGAVLFAGRYGKKL